MNRYHLVPILTLTSIFALYLSATAETKTREIITDANGSAKASEIAKTAAIVRMEKEQARIAARLGMSAPMEIETVNGRDPVAELIQSGFVIEATLEQVESALAAAAATPDPEDDQYALELKHRGSYRFFAP